MYHPIQIWPGRKLENKNKLISVFDSILHILSLKYTKKYIYLYCYFSKYNVLFFLIIKQWINLEFC